MGQEEAAGPGRRDISLLSIKVTDPDPTLKRERKKQDPDPTTDQRIRNENSRQLFLSQYNNKNSRLFYMFFLTILDIRQKKVSGGGATEDIEGEGCVVSSCLLKNNQPIRGQKFRLWNLGFRVPVIYLYCNICISLVFDS